MRTFGVQGLLLAVGYAFLYAVLREASVTHWLLPAGLRFAALLFLPYRCWPAIIVGDIAGSLYYRADRIPTFGVPWIIATLVGPIVSSVLPVLTLRLHRWGKDPSQLAASAAQMLVAGLASSLMSAACGIGAMKLIHYGPTLQALPAPALHYLALFTVGDYLGILVIAPAMFSYLPLGRLKDLASHTFETITPPGYAWSVFASASFLGFLMMTTIRSRSEEVQLLARAAMLLPVVAMTFRHGWLGAVPTVFLGNLAIQATIQTVGAPELIDAQFLMAIVGSAMLILGATATEHQTKSKVLAKESRRYLDLARRNLKWGEIRAFQSAAVLESAFTEFDITRREGELDVYRQSPSERARIRWSSALAARNDVQMQVEYLRMTALRTQGIRIALLAGPTAATLSEAGVSLAVRVTGDTRTMPDDMHSIAYRMANEFIMRLVRDHCSRRVRVRLVVSKDARRSIAIVVKVRRGERPAPNVPAPHATSYEVKNIADTYHGIFHDRSKRQHPTLALLLRDR